MTERPRYMSPSWHYVRMLELEMKTVDQLEASFCAAHCAGDTRDAKAISEALEYVKTHPQPQPPRNRGGTTGERNDG